MAPAILEFVVEVAAPILFAVLAAICSFTLLIAATIQLIVVVAFLVCIFIVFIRAIVAVAVTTHIGEVVVAAFVLTAAIAFPIALFAELFVAAVNVQMRFVVIRNYCLFLLSLFNSPQESECRQMRIILSAIPQTAASNLPVLSSASRSKNYSPTP